MKFTYSIIIPHRDSIDLLKRAVSSIPDRADIQIIVVDNSTSELDFSNLDRKMESNILLLYSDPQKGAGHARNVGLKKVQGLWILFLDADDFYNPGAFEKFDTYINSDFDIVYFSLSSVFSDTLKLADRHIYNNNLVVEFLSGKENSEDNLRYRYITPYCKLLRAALVFEYKLEFDEVPAGNDMMFSVKAGYYAKAVIADTFYAYCSTVTRCSLTNTISIKNSRSRFNIFIRQYKFMTSIDKPNMRFLLMAEIVTSLRFGPKEFWWYISTIYKERVNIFLGIERWPSVLYRYFFKKKNNDGYTTIIK